MHPSPPQVPLREMEAYSSVDVAELLGEVKAMVKADRVSLGGVLHFRFLQVARGPTFNLLLTTWE